jgi:hypothetical protein
VRLFLDTSFESDWAKGVWQTLSASWNVKDGVTVCASPELADFILVTIADPRASYPATIETLSRQFRNSPQRDRMFVFDPQDDPLGLFPGVYASLRDYLFDKRRHRTGGYMKTFNEFVAYRDPAASIPDFLFSFQGNLTSRVRRNILSIDFGRSDICIEQTRPFWKRTGAPESVPFKKRYAETMWRSKFVLCPRGVGTSSFRLFETMQSGRVPIIISDSWVPSKDIHWEKFSLRVRERDIRKIPQTCLATEHRWMEMGRQARRAWVDRFGETGLGNHIQASLPDIVKTRRFSEQVHLLQWPLRLTMAAARRASVTYASQAMRWVGR